MGRGEAAVTQASERDEEAEKRIGSERREISVVTFGSLGTNVFAADCVLSAFRIRFSEVKAILPRKLSLLR